MRGGAAGKDLGAVERSWPGLLGSHRKEGGLEWGSGRVPTKAYCLPSPTDWVLTLDASCRKAAPAGHLPCPFHEEPSPRRVLGQVHLLRAQGTAVVSFSIAPP